MSAIASCAAVHGSGADLLRAARRAGRVRADLTPDELFDLLGGAAWVRENALSEGRDQTDRYLRLILEGMVTHPRTG
ncbi:MULTISPECIES: hypothetical protein [unclassified Streptomyces]|uniref:SbtR family transcriptional regulator n=1 Tax=unclassified Streptomyces TaxID=2593676 RepID=UPI0033A9975C